MVRQFFSSLKPSKTKAEQKLSYKNGVYGVVLDCHGKEVVECVSCNTRTGWAITNVLDVKGNAQLDPDETQVWVEKKRHPYPLRFKRIEA